MSRRRLIVLGGAAILLSAGLVAILGLRACGRSEPDPIAVTIPVALPRPELPDGAKIGIILTLGQDGVEGAEWGAAAQGALVAQYRLVLGGADIELLVEDDHGTEEGGAEAVASLARRGASGLVIASSGAHVSAAAEAASEAGLPALLPYEPVPAGASLLGGVWSLTPSHEQITAEINRMLKPFVRPVLLDLGDAPLPKGLGVVETLSSERGDIEGLARAAAQRTGAELETHGVYIGGDETAASEPAGKEPKGTEAPAPQSPPPPFTPPPQTPPPADALAVSGSATGMAALVAALEARNVSMPVILAPAATSPAFARTLNERKGTVSTTLRTVGTGEDDSTALAPDAAGRAMSAFLQALRQLAVTDGAKNLNGDAPFAEAAPWADARSHDAVLAIASAIAEARSTAPEQVLAALAGLRLAAADGIAGGELDFGGAQAASAPVRPLYATEQRLGLRPQDPESLALGWVVEPEAAEPQEQEAITEEGRPNADPDRD